MLSYGYSPKTYVFCHSSFKGADQRQKYQNLFEEGRNNYKESGNSNSLIKRWNDSLKIFTEINDEYIKAFANNKNMILEGQGDFVSWMYIERLNWLIKNFGKLKKEWNGVWEFKEK